MMIKYYKLLIKLHRWKKAARISKYKMTNFDHLTNEDKIQDNPKWPSIPDNRHSILIIGFLEQIKQMLY